MRYLQEHADRAEAILIQYRVAVGDSDSDNDTIIRDLLQDLMHYIVSLNDPTDDPDSKLSGCLNAAVADFPVEIRENSEVAIWKCYRCGRKWNEEREGDPNECECGEKPEELP